MTKIVTKAPMLGVGTCSTNHYNTFENVKKYIMKNDLELKKEDVGKRCESDREQQCIDEERQYKLM